MRERRVGFHWSLRVIRFRSAKESISSSRRSSSSIMSSSEKVGLSAAMVGLEVWKLDGEAVEMRMMTMNVMNTTTRMMIALRISP